MEADTGFVFFHRCSCKFWRGLVCEFLFPTLLALSRSCPHGTWLCFLLLTPVRIDKATVGYLTDVWCTPQWREFAKEMDGVIRISAVNCGDNGMLCRSKGINSYPSLYVFRAGMVRTFCLYQHMIHNACLMSVVILKYTCNHANRSQRNIMATEQNQASPILQCSLWKAKWQNYGKVMTFYILFYLNLEIQIMFRVHATKAKDSCTKKWINAN